jgi:Ni/Co efflux regulator RcnB
MKKIVIAALAATTALTGVMTSGAAAAQPGHYDRGYERDYDRGYDRRDLEREHRREDRQLDRRQEREIRHYERDDRRARQNWNRWYGRDRWAKGHRYYGGKYGYNGYRGHWKTGERYPYWRDNAYVINDYRTYRLPPPRTGYRYYRDDNGDIVMAAIASGVIGLIIGSQLN